MEIKNRGFYPNDFVWAKVTGYSYWPAVILTPEDEAPEQPKSDMFWVYFFGSHNYAWIHERYIKDFKDHDEKYTKSFIEKLHKPKRTSRRRKSVAETRGAPRSVKINEKDRKIEAFFRAKDELLYNLSNVSYSEHFDVKIEPLRRSGSRASSRRSASRISRGMDQELSRAHSRASSTSSLASSRTSFSGRSSILTNRSNGSGYFQNHNNQLFNGDGYSRENLAINKSRIGILIQNIYGEGIARNIIGYGHTVVIWSPSPDVCYRLKNFAGTSGLVCKAYQDYRDVVRKCPIIFSLTTTQDEAREILDMLGVSDPTNPLLHSKIYLQMTMMDMDTSHRYWRLIQKEKPTCQYLEALIIGWRDDMTTHDFILLLGGESDTIKTVLREYKSVFCSIGDSWFHAGELGRGSQLKAILQGMKSAMICGFVESLALLDSEHCGTLQWEIVGQALQETGLMSPYLSKIFSSILSDNYTSVAETVRSLQEDLRYALDISEKVQQGCPMMATTNQVLKHARRVGFDLYDTSILYLRAKYTGQNNN